MKNCIFLCFSKEKLLLCKTLADNGKDPISADLNIPQFENPTE